MAKTGLGLAESGAGNTLFKSLAIDRLSKREGCSIHKRRHSMYSDSNDSVHAVAAVSKAYDEGKSYWYAYHHDPQRRFLSQGGKGYMLLRMINRDYALAVPYEFLKGLRESIFETTAKEGRFNKHPHTLNVRSRFCSG